MTAWRALGLAAWVAMVPAAAQMSGKSDPAAAIQYNMQWQMRIAKARPAADETLYLLVHSARDCGWCTKWKQDPAGLGVAKKLVDDFPGLRVFIVERRSLQEPERRNQYHPDLAFEFERREAAGALTPGVPAFELFLGGQAVFRGGGVDSWSTRVVPAIVRIEQQRERRPPVAGP